MIKKIPCFVIILLILIISSCNENPTGKRVKESPKELKMHLTKEKFGLLNDSVQVYLYTLKNKNGIEVKITNYGGIITSIITPDREGVFQDIALGFNKLDPYIAGHPYFGAIVGRCANRIANGSFDLNGKTYQLATNNGPKHLHGGFEGFDK